MLLPGDERQVGLRFVAGSTQKVGFNRLHLHLTSASPEGQRATIEKALSIGGCHLDFGQLPEEGHVVLSDPGDNEFCVIEAGNGFLAGCGPLGEVACDGAHADWRYDAATLGLLPGLRVDNRRRSDEDCGHGGHRLAAQG